MVSFEGFSSDLMNVPSGIVAQPKNSILLHGGQVDPMTGVVDPSFKILAPTMGFQRPSYTTH